MLYNEQWDKTKKVFGEFKIDLTPGALNVIDHPLPMFTAFEIPHVPERVRPKPDDKPQEEWRTALIAAANYIEKRGWVQGTAENHLGQVCAQQAIMVAAPDAYVHSQAMLHLCRHTGFGSVPSWNDRHGRTKAEVVSTMRFVALAGAA